LVRRRAEAGGGALEGRFLFADRRVSADETAKAGDERCRDMALPLDDQKRSAQAGWTLVDVSKTGLLARCVRRTAERASAGEIISTIRALGCLLRMYRRAFARASPAACWSR
jgi:hypothetical protein